jgi:uncharacterized protein (DUF952 family)
MVTQDPILHVAAPGDWQRARPDGRYYPPGYASEGFIHCCSRGQLERVLRDHFSGHSQLVVVVLDPAKIASEIRYERAPAGDDYPHIYGPIERGVIVDEINVRTENGVWLLPF